MMEEEIAMSEGGGIELCIEIFGCSWIERQTYPRDRVQSGKTKGAFDLEKKLPNQTPHFWWPLHMEPRLLYSTKKLSG